MKKAFKFVESLTSQFIDLFGYPTIKVGSEYTEVYFDSSAVINSLGIFNVPNDGFRMFAGDNGCITYVFTFYND